MAVVLAWPASAAEGLTALLRDIHWGESADALVRQFGTAARWLPQPLDFGDSYADVVLEGDTLGGVPVAVFFQMDKMTHGLKRVQVEPLGHEINPPAYRAIAAALNAEYGQPTQRCITPPVPDAGFQAAVEERWQHDDTAISAIFRDTTLQAFEVAFTAPPAAGAGCRARS